MPFLYCLSSLSKLDFFFFNQIFNIADKNYVYVFNLYKLNILNKIFYIAIYLQIFNGLVA